MSRIQLHCGKQRWTLEGADVVGAVTRGGSVARHAGEWVCGHGRDRGQQSGGCVFPGALEGCASLEHREETKPQSKTETDLGRTSVSLCLSLSLHTHTHGTQHIVP